MRPHSPLWIPHPDSLEAEWWSGLGGEGTLGSDVTLKNALIWEPFVRFKKFKGLIRLEFNFLLFGQTVRHLPCNSGIKQINR